MTDAVHVEGVAHPRVRPLLSRPAVGFAETAPPGTWHMPPSTSVTLIVNVGEAFGGLPGSFAAGLEDRCTVVARGGTMACVDLKLTPLGAYSVLGTRMDDLAGVVVDLDDLFGVDGRRLTEQVREEATWTQRFQCVDRFLMRRAAAGHAPCPEVAWAWQRLEATGGRLRIAALADELGWSQRRLIAKCREQIGLSPKTAARVLRFHRLLRSLDSAGPVDWSRLAAEHGYYDQSHLTRDFQQFTGSSPAAYLSSRTPDGSIVTDDVPVP